MLNGQFDSFTEKYSFCQIKTYFVRPDEDLGLALNTHVKVALLPNCVYELNNPIVIVTNCYLIGNGSTIKINCKEKYVITIANCLRCPAITGMPFATFTNVQFCGNSDIRGNVFHALSHTMFHGCSFIDFDGTCIRSTIGIVVRGCLFVACKRCLRADGNYSVTIKQCSFKSCLVCIATKCDFEIFNNLVDDCYSFLLTSGSGKFINNNITGPLVESLDRFKDVELVTCFGGKTNVLCSVHFVENKSKNWPRMDNNNFYRVKLFCGYRRGILHPHHSSFHFSHICLDFNSANKVSLHGCYDQSVKISKVLNYDENKRILSKCECGVTHVVGFPVYLDVTDAHKVDPYLHSCQALEYSSDEE